MKKHRSKTKTFKEQLTKDFLVVAVILILLLSTVFIFATIKQTRDELQNNMYSSAELASEQFAFITDNMAFISSYLLSDMDFLNAATQLTRDDIKAEEMLEYYKTIQSPIINYSIVSSKYNVTFFNDEGFIAASNDYNLDYSFSSRISSAEWERMPWLRSVQHILGKAVFLPVQQKPFEENSEKALMLVREIRAPGTRVGYLIVDISAEDLFKTIDPNTEGSWLMIEDKTGTLLYSSEGTPEEVVEMDGRNADTLHDNGYISYSVEKQGYCVRMITPMAVMWKNVLESTVFLLVMALVVIFAAVVLIYSLSRRYTRSIEMLTTQIAAINLASLQNQEESGTAEEMVYSDYSEISYLYTAFNNMQSRLNKMINSEIAWKTRQIEQRFQMLQSQINPHFMYNTLNAIGLLGLESGNRTVFGACRSFSNLLRYSIVDKNGSISSIGEEIENIRDYLQLMKLRFEEDCVFKINEEEAVTDQKIPRVAIQPFVENIFEHAMHGKRITINITTKVNGDRWEIIIQDDGPGMDEEKLQDLRRLISKEIQSADQIEDERIYTSIGIVNTVTRLRIYFGDDFLYDLTNTSPGFRISLSGIIRKI